MVEIFGKLVEFEIGRDTIHRPGLGVWLKSTEQHLACIFLVIGAFIRHAQHRHLGQPGNRLCHDVEMLAGMKRHVDAQHPAHLMAPHAAAIDDHVTGDLAGFFALRPIDTGDAAPIALHAGGERLFDDLRPVLPRTLGQSERNIGRVTLTIQWQVNPSGHAVDVQMIVTLFYFLGRDLFHLDTKGAGHPGLPVDLFLALFCQGNRDRPAALESCRNASLGFQTAIKLLRILGEFCHIRRRTQLRNQSGGMPCRARCQLFPFQQHHIFPAQF